MDASVDQTPFNRNRGVEECDENGNGKKSQKIK